VTTNAVILRGRRAALPLLLAVLVSVAGCQQTSEPRHDLGLQPAVEGWKRAGGEGERHVWNGRLVRVTVEPRLGTPEGVRVLIDNLAGSECRVFAEASDIRHLGTYRREHGRRDWEAQQSLVLRPEDGLMLSLNRLPEIEWPREGRSIGFMLKVLNRAKREAIPMRFQIVSTDSQPALVPTN